MILKKAATENTEFTEGKQLLTVNFHFTHQASPQKMRNPLYLRVLCDLCGLNCGLE